MQIDGHHAATYVAARLAGLGYDEAATVAYAAQYVDDATNAGVIQFEDSAYLYSRIASAHQMIDYNNLVDVENHLAWIPFHFLPGHCGQPAGQAPQARELDKLVCRADSPVARDMLRYALGDRSHARALHRLGIAMHVYADTFAHQGFVGAMSVVNQASGLTSGDAALDAAIAHSTRQELWRTVRSKLRAVWQLLLKACAVMVSERRWPYEYFSAMLKTAPIGHAAVDVYPDQPYLRWCYVDAQGRKVQRDNPETFDLAFDRMVRAMRAWRAGDASMDLLAHEGPSAQDAAAAGKLFRELTDVDGAVRHGQWQDAIRAGAFSFGSDAPDYQPKGRDSWKHTALGTRRARDSGVERFTYSDAFLASDWKLFHDALQAHRSDVIHEILPRYGICAA